MKVNNKVLWDSAKSVKIILDNWEAVQIQHTMNMIPDKLQSFNIHPKDRKEHFKNSILLTVMDGSYASSFSCIITLDPEEAESILIFGGDNKSQLFKYIKHRFEERYKELILDQI